MAKLVFLYKLKLSDQVPFIRLPEYANEQSMNKLNTAIH